MKKVRELIPIAPTRPRREAQYVVLAGVSGMAVDCVADITYDDRKDRDRTFSFTPRRLKSLQLP